MVGIPVMQEPESYEEAREGLARPPNAAGTAAAAAEDLELAEAEEDEQEMTPLPEGERCKIVDARTGLPAEPATPGCTYHEHIVVALDPDDKTGQSELAINAAKKLCRKGDLLVLLSVLPARMPSYPGLFSVGPQSISGNDIEWEIKSLLRMRSMRMDALADIASTFPPEVKVYGHILHGKPGEQILRCADNHHATLIILGKRRLSRWDKLMTQSVSNFVSSRSDCPVLIAK